MKIPIDKLLSIEGNKYEFTVAAIKLIEKAGGATIEDMNLDSWKIVPTVLRYMLEERFQYDFPERLEEEVAGEVAEDVSEEAESNVAIAAEEESTNLPEEENSPS